MKIVFDAMKIAKIIKDKRETVKRERERGLKIV